MVVLAALVAAGCTVVDRADRIEVEVDGQPWEVLLATDDGMRGLDGFDGADGMLFDADDDVDPQSIFFVMDGVAFPLDIAWFRADGGLVGTATMPMCPANPCPRHAAPAPFRWAIEAPVGAFDALTADARLEVGPG
jgi:uncharacterized membrane protein (UPF0127 family)